MGSPVDFSRQSRKNLREIVAYIARHDRGRAKTFGDVLYRKAMILGDHPEMGRVIPGLEDPSVREIVHGAHRIIYEVATEPKRIFILRFWHAARGNPQIMED